MAVYSELSFAKRAPIAYRRDFWPGQCRACRIFRITMNVTSAPPTSKSIERNGLRAMHVHAAPMSGGHAGRSADFRDRDDRLSGGCRDWSRIWRVLLEPKMGPSPMIVPAVDREDASQVRLVEHDHVVEAFATD